MDHGSLKWAPQNFFEVAYKIPIVATVVYHRMNAIEAQNIFRLLISACQKLENNISVPWFRIRICMQTETYIIEYSENKKVFQFNNSIHAFVNNRNFTLRQFRSFTIRDHRGIPVFLYFSGYNSNEVHCVARKRKTVVPMKMDPVFQYIVRLGSNVLCFLLLLCVSLFFSQTAALFVFLRENETLL